MSTEAESMNLPATVIVKNQAEADARIPGAVRRSDIHLRIDPMEGGIRYLRQYLRFFPPGDCPRRCSHAFEECPECGLPSYRILSVTVSGGERPIHPQWVRKLRDECASAGVGFRFESWGDFGPCELYPIDAGPLSVITSLGLHLTGRRVLDAAGEYENAEIVAFVGRERSGRTLDGVVHDGEVQPR